MVGLTLMADENGLVSAWGTRTGSEIATVKLKAPAVAMVPLGPQRVAIANKTGHTVNTAAYPPPPSLSLKAEIEAKYGGR